jgi:hypothetical protein
MANARMTIIANPAEASFVDLRIFFPFARYAHFVCTVLRAGTAPVFRGTYTCNRAKPAPLGNWFRARYGPEPSRSSALGLTTRSPALSWGVSSMGTDQIHVLGVRVLGGPDRLCQHGPIDSCESGPSPSRRPGGSPGYLHLRRTHRPDSGVMSPWAD